MRELTIAPLNDQVALMEENRIDYMNAIIQSLGTIMNEDHIQVVLAIISVIIDKSGTELFLSGEGFGEGYGLIDALNGIYNRQDYSLFTKDLAYKILCMLYADMKQMLPVVGDCIRTAIGVLVQLPGKSDNLLIHLSGLKYLLKNSKCQDIFIDMNGVRVLADLIPYTGQSQNIQLIYLVGFCVWALSFNTSSHNIYDYFLKENIVGLLCDVIAQVSREKVVRVIIGTFSNLCGRSVFNEAMIQKGFLKTLKILSSKKWTDNDVIEDIEFLDKALEQSLSELTTFDMYKKEIMVGHLQWSQVHTERFWKENVLSFEDNDFEQIRKLIDLLESEDPLTVQVACFDLGEFVRMYPGGRKILARLKGKERLLLKMTHPNSDVQRQALLAVQKLMVQNWSFLQR